MFRPYVFPMRRAAAALCRILPRAQLPPRELAIGVFDPDGALCGQTHPFLPLASDVRIVTRQAERFGTDVLTARRAFGASLTVGEDASLLRNCDAVVCVSPDEAFRGVPVVLSCIPAEDAFCVPPVRLPDSLARICPRSVPPDLFAAALTERCGLNVPDLYACTLVSFGGQQMDVQQAAQLWRSRIQRSRR